MFIPIRPISLSQMIKLDHKSLVTSIIDVMKQFDLKALQLEAGMNMLMELRPQTLKLEVEHGPHPLTKDLKQINERRLELAGVISTHLQVLERAKIERQRDDVHTVSFPIRDHLLGIRKENRVATTELISKFISVVEKNGEVKEALERLGFVEFMNEMEAANNTFMELHRTRNSSTTKRPTRESKAIQKECQAVLRNLFNHIELAQSIYKDQDYTSLITNINTVLAKFTKTIKRRATYNKKRRAEAAKKAAEMEAKEYMLSIDGKETGSVIIEGKAKEKKMKLTRSPKKQATKTISKASKPAPNRKEGANKVMNILKIPPEAKE